MAQKVKKVALSQPSRLFSPTSLILLGIFLLAALLRLFHLGLTPIGFHVDELNVGYIGRYIFLHGKDVVGHWLPLYFNKFGDFRPTGIFYLSGLSTFLFGVNEFAVRFPSAFIGALTIFPMYLLTTLLTGRKRVGVIAAFLLATSPWHIVLARATSESIVGLFLFLFGVWFMIRAIQEDIPRFVFLASLLLAGSYFFYHPFRLLVPVFAAIFALKGKGSRVSRLLWIVAGLFFVFTIAFSLTKAGSGRLGQVVFYKNPGLASTMEALLSGDGGVPLLVTRIFHNKPILFAREYVYQYLSYYSPGFLFLSGGYPDRYRVPEEGLFYIVLSPMVLMGLIFLLKDVRYRSSQLFILFCLFLSTLPASITYEDTPNVQRALPLLFPLIFLAAHGIDTSMSLLREKRKALLVSSIVFSLIFVFESALFLHLYAVHADSHKSVYRNVGTKELFVRIQSLYSSVDYIVMSVYDELPMYAAFYFNRFDTFPKTAYLPSPGELHIGKMIFIESKCPLTEYKGKRSGKGVFIEYEGCKGLGGAVEQQAITRTDSTTAYRIYLTDN